MAKNEKPVQTNLRIMSGLHRRLEVAAHKNGTSLNNEMRVRLERSLDGDSLSTLNDVAADIDIAWHKFSEHFATREIDDEILQAIEARNFDKAHALVRALRRHQASMAQQRLAKMSEKGEQQ